MVIGITLLIIGVIYLLNTLGVIEVPIMLGDLVLPLLLIIAGVYLIMWSIKIRRFKDYKHKLLHFKDGFKK